MTISELLDRARALRDAIADLRQPPQAVRGHVHHHVPDDHQNAAELDALAAALDSLTVRAPRNVAAATRQDVAERARVATRTITRWMLTAPGCPIGEPLDDTWAQRCDAWIAAVRPAQPVAEPILNSVADVMFVIRNYMARVAPDERDHLAGYEVESFDSTDPDFIAILDEVLPGTVDEVVLRLRAAVPSFEIDETLRLPPENADLFDQVRRHLVLSLDESAGSS